MNELIKGDVIVMVCPDVRTIGWIARGVIVSWLVNAIGLMVCWVPVEEDLLSSSMVNLVREGGLVGLLMIEDEGDDGV